MKVLVAARLYLLDLAHTSWHTAASRSRAANHPDPFGSQEVAGMENVPNGLGKWLSAQGLTVENGKIGDGNGFKPLPYGKVEEFEVSSDHTDGPVILMNGISSYYGSYGLEVREDPGNVEGTFMVCTGNLEVLMVMVTGNEKGEMRESTPALLTVTCLPDATS